MGLGLTAVLGDPFELFTFCLGHRDRCVDLSVLTEAVLGVQTGLHPLGQVDLLLRGEELASADGLQVGVDRVAHGG